MGWPVLGRDSEAHVIREFLGSLGAGGPGVLGILGPAGIGKTTVWRHVVETARERDLRVLGARPGPTETRAAFSVLTDLFRTVDDPVLAHLPAPQLRALSAALLRRDLDAHVDPRAVSAAALTTLARLAEDRPVVVAVDDLHWADRSSVRVVEHLARRLDGLRIGLVVSSRVDDEDAPVGRSVGLSAALSAAEPRRLVLAPLDVDALGSVLEQQLGRALPRRALLRIHALSAGNPFFALELARALPDEPSAHAPVGLPPQLRELTHARIGRLPAATRTTLVAMAAQESPTLDLVAAALASSADRVARDLEPAVDAGLVVVGPGAATVRFSHPLYAVGVYDSASGSARRRIHQRLARAVPTLEERARHSALGAVGPDADIAALLETAADSARRRGSPEAAAELALQAREMTPADHPDDAARRGVAVASYWFHAGEPGSARELLEALLAQPLSDPVRGEALRVLGEIRYHQDSFPEAVELFEAALGCAGLTPTLACWVELHWAFGSVSAGDFPAARLHARRALARLEGVTDQALEADVLAVATIADYLVGEGLDEARLERALELEDPFQQVSMSLRPSLIAGYLMILEGRLARADELLTGCRDAALRRGDESDLPLVSTCLTWVECRRGRLDDAERYTQEALGAARLLGSEAAECLALAHASVPAAYAGRTSQARVRAERATRMAHETGAEAASLWAAWGLGVAALMDGDPAGVDAALGPFVRVVEERGIPGPVSVMFLPDEIEALVALGQLDRADRLTGLLEQAARRQHRDWPLVAALRCRALLHAARGEVAAAAAAADAAVERCAGLELTVEVARTLLVAGGIARRSKRKRRARELLERAVRLFTDVGCPVLRARAVAELERVSGGTEQAPLTATEWQVASLSASGLTNREVATRLGISPKTVESNLSRTYRKLAIHSRAELGSRLGPAAAGAEQPPGG
jgi:DNA-binding CsgD family transcriptional regulator